VNSNALTDFRRYKALIIAYLDQREKELLKELNAIRDKETAALEKLKTTATAIQADLCELQTKLRHHEERSHELFIATKRSRAVLTTLKSSLNEIHTTWNGYVHVQKDPLVEKLMSNKKGLAQVISVPGSVI